MRLMLAEIEVEAAGGSTIVPADDTMSEVADDANNERALAAIRANQLHTQFPEFISCARVEILVGSTSVPSDVPVGRKRVPDAFRAAQAVPLTTRKCPENGGQSRHPGTLENCMGFPTSAAVRRPSGV